MTGWAVGVASQNGIELVNLSNSKSIDIFIDGIPAPIVISELFLEELNFVSIANPKVHPYERMTAILRNSFGLLTNGDISSLHFYLSLLISHLHRLCSPDLGIVDGRIGRKEQGPISGDLVRTNSIVFSNDALEAKSKAFQQLPYLDVYVSRLPPEDASFVQQMNYPVHPICGEEKVLIDGFEGMAAVEVVTSAYDHLSRPLETSSAELVWGTG
jgi:hypothetical protein